MKKLLLTGFATVLSILAAAQPTEEKKWSLGIHGGFDQYNGDLGQGWYSTRQAAYGFGGVSVARQLTRRLDAVFFGTRGELGHMEPREEWMDPGYRTNFLARVTTFNLYARYFLISREYILQPYVFGGAGVIMQHGLSDTYYPDKKKFDYAIPTAGLGLNIRIFPWLAFQLQETFMHTSADYIDFKDKGFNDLYLLHSAGLIFRLSKPEKSGTVSTPEFVVDKCPKHVKEQRKKSNKQAKTKARVKKIKSTES
jgi:hypothetical protein